MLPLRVSWDEQGLNTMPLGIITEEQLQEELSRNGNQSVEIKRIERGRGNKTETPESIRNIVGEESVNGAVNKELEALFHVSPSSISAYKNGATSTASYNKPNEKLANHIAGIKNKISGKAGKRALLALNALTDEKIADASAREIAGIAKDMSAIIRNMEPQERTSHVGDNVQFIFMAPPIKSERDYEIIEVNE